MIGFSKIYSKLRLFTMLPKMFRMYSWNNFPLSVGKQFISRVPLDINGYWKSFYNQSVSAAIVNLLLNDNDLSR